MTFVLPMRSESSTARAMVSSEVSRARTISTSFITGAGLKKWMPQKFHGRSRTLAMPVMGMVEVFDAMTAFSERCFSTAPRTPALTPASS